MSPEQEARHLEDRLKCRRFFNHGGVGRLLDELQKSLPGGLMYSGAVTGRMTGQVQYKIIMDEAYYKEDDRREKLLLLCK